MCYVVTLCSVIGCGVYRLYCIVLSHICCIYIALFCDTFLHTLGHYLPLFHLPFSIHYMLLSVSANTVTFHLIAHH